MKYRPIIPLYLLFILMIIFQFSCAKDSDLIADFIIEENLEDLSDIELENALLIPLDFDWTNIPVDYGNTVWKITESFDLKGASIRLPEGVTLYFNGGELTNGTLTGSKTLIASQGSSQVFDAVSLTGTFENDYLMPYWFGAAMDGITDDREAFIETLAQSNKIGAKVLVEKDIFLDVEETGTKSIFLEDNTWIEGANGAKIIINNLRSPAFYIALSENITIKNVTFLYDQEYDASYDWSVTSDNHLNQQQLEDYLTANNNITFESTNPVFKGPTSFYTVFSLDAAQDVLFENVSFKAKGNKANNFMQFIFKFKEQYTERQTITEEGNASADTPKNITLKNVVFDGYLMGFQGNVQNLNIDNLKAYRYSDLQNEDGSNLGGLVNGAYLFPPPHLFYLNTDSSFSGKYPNNITLLNIIDYGDYIGTTNVRPTYSGYCHSLKLVGHVENIVVDNYKSYRRDGLGDLGGITNGVFSNIYAESKVNIFNPSFIFNSLRFVGDLNNVLFENITIKDNSDVLEIYPLDFASGNYVVMDNVHVFVNELKTTNQGPFGISGSNNTVVNSSLTIQKHLDTEDYKGVIFHDNTTLDTGKNNSYNIVVNGWRSIEADPTKKSIEILLANSSNSNTNFAKVSDTSNNCIIEQTKNVKKVIWTRKEEVILEQGISQKLNMFIPAGYAIKTISATTIENLNPDIQVSIGTSVIQKENLLPNISKTAGIVSNSINELTAAFGNRYIYLYSNKDFDKTGKIEVSLELGRVSEYD